MCQAIGTDVVSTKPTFLCFESFRNGDFSLEDGQRSGRPTEIGLSELMRVIESDPTLNTREA